MTRRIHGVFLSLAFPAGIAAGEGKDYNTLAIARNGEGKPVLRGTALAGVLRHAWREYLRRTQPNDAGPDVTVNRFFGCALGDNEALTGVGSPLHVSDCVLDVGGQATVVRTHHLRNRHTGTVADGGLFTLEACPPHTTTTVALWLRDDDSAPDTAIFFLQTLVGFLEKGIALGGNTARGIGMARLIGVPIHRAYELAKVDDYAAWLDDRKAWRRDSSKIPAGHPIQSAVDANTSLLEVRFCLGIPRGQDVLVGDGQGLDHEIEPQRVRAADGRMYWRLPGASLRGVFRAWITRLAAREGHPVADSVQGHNKNPDSLTGANLGWCFLPEEKRHQGIAKTDCPVAALFGSLFQAGRIHFSDAYAPFVDKEDYRTSVEEQLRMHVAVDRITGGAAESMLFDNTVLTADPQGNSPCFDVTIRVQGANENEARWLAGTLRALDLGILRIGSSKSSGRMSLVEQPQATGSGAEFLAAIQPACGQGMFSTMACSINKEQTTQGHKP